MAEARPVTPGRVFVSYRRDETDFPASWLYERLALHFGREQVFKDVDSIELGDDFAEVIATAVASCDVLLALIGTQWLTITDGSGTPRLENPDDFVRLEIEAALQRRVRVIPILVGEAHMPRADKLPPSLAKLARRQALALNPHRFEADTRRLVQAVEKTIAEQEQRREAERAAQHAAAEADRQEREGQAAEAQARRQAEQEAAEVQARIRQLAEAEDGKLASIGGLAGSLGQGDQAATAAALAALRRFAADDSRRVASAARGVLADWDHAQRLQAEAARRGAEEADRRVRARQAAEAQARHDPEREADAKERRRQERDRRAAEAQARIQQAAEIEEYKLASIRKLRGSLGQDDQAATAAALAALRRSAEDDSRRVASAARGVLADWDHVQRREVHAPLEAAEEVPRQQEAKRAAEERAGRTSDQTVEEQGRLRQPAEAGDHEVAPTGGSRHLSTRTPPVDRLAMTSLIVAIVGLIGLPGMGSALALPFAITSRRRIRSSGGSIGGLTQANVAIAMGIIGPVVAVLLLILFSQQ
jgi:hypothetical protein